MKDILQPENLEPDRLLLRHYNNVQREHGLMVANGIKNELKRRNDIRQVQREMENSSGVASDVAPVLPPSIVARKPSLSLAAAPIPAFRASLSHTPTSTLEGLHS